MGADFFFYGTLLDADVFDHVLRRSLAGEDVTPAFLTGFERVYALGVIYPTLSPKTGARVEGLLVRGLSEEDRDRLIAFEGSRFTLTTATIDMPSGETQTANLFMPSDPAQVTTVPWGLDDWQERHKPAFLAKSKYRQGGA